MGLHDFLMKHGIGSPGRMAKTQALIYRRFRERFPGVSNRQILAEMYRRRAEVGVRTGLRDVYGMYEDPAWVDSVVETNPDLLSMTVYLVLCEHPEIRSPQAPADAFSLLVDTVEDVLDREVPGWQQELETGDALVKLFLRAGQGDTNSQRKLGDLFLLGTGVPEDRVRARNWYESAAESGDIEAQCALAELLSSDDDHAEAARWYRAAADREIIENNPNRVLVAEAGVELGTMYAEGVGVPKNLREAAEWYRRAAELGSAAAQVCLGLSYANGSGVPQDFELAYQWLEIAIANGSVRGDEYRRKLSNLLDSTEITRAKEIARDLIETNPLLMRELPN